ncbi:response regulator [soil metagenome]
MRSFDPTGPAAQSPADLAADLPADVLVVEDDTLIAMDTAETIAGFGVASVQTARDVAGALQKIATRAPDFVLLDVGLIREKSFVVAEQLERQNIPFAFVTGYSGPAGVPATFARYPVLRKPYTRDELMATLRKWRGQD